MKHIWFILSIVWFTNLVNAQETKHKIFCDKSKSSITYAMHHPLHDWEGVSKEVTSVIVTNSDGNEILQVAVSVKIASFDSKNANRDSHTIEVTKALKYPSITFASTKIQPITDSLKVTGTLSFHGKKKQIGFTVFSSLKKGKFRVKGGFEISMTDFGIEPPTLMAIATNDAIKIEFDLVYSQ